MSEIPRTEVDLARALLGGDDTAFEPFVQSFQSRLFQYAWLMCGQREDAEEVAQETLMKVFESFDQLREPEHVKSWVFRIARNFCLMRRRRSVFAPRVEQSIDDWSPESAPAAAFQLADKGELPDSQMLRGELKQHLEEALRLLPESYRPVVLLRDVEGMSTAETAAILELSDDVVKQRLHRGRLALRKLLSGYVQPAHMGH